MSPKQTAFQLLHWANEECLHPSRLIRLLHSLCRVTFITFQEFRKNDLSLRASALTFTIMLSLVPILAMSTAVVKGLGGGDQLRKAVYSYIETLDYNQGKYQLNQEDHTARLEPPPDEDSNSSLTQHLHSAVDYIFDYVDRTNFATLGTVGVVGIFLSVILVFGNIEMAMNSIWHVHSGRKVMRKISDYLALIVLMPISLNIGLASSAVLKSDALLSKFSLLLPIVWIQPLILKFIPVFFLALTLYVIYLFFPNTRVKNFPAFAGAVFAGYFWFLAQNIYISLQIGVSNYNAIYGSFATLPLFLVWIYFGWIFILIGAQIAYAFQHKDSFSLIPSSAPPSLRLAVAYDIIEYVRDRFEQEAPATVTDFIERFPMHTKPLIEENVEQLKESGLIHYSSEGALLKPSIPQQKVDHKKIVAAILGDTFSKTKGGETSSTVLRAAAEPLQRKSTET